MNEEQWRRIELSLETIARSMTQLTEAVVMMTELLRQHLESRESK
jgi:hypothetical protein